MTKPVTLSDRAFAALRREKKNGESDSDVVNRLLHEARTARKDPFRLVGAPLKRATSVKEHLRMIEDAREADRHDPWEEPEKRLRSEPGKRPRATSKKR